MSGKILSRSILSCDSCENKPLNRFIHYVDEVKRTWFVINDISHLFLLCKSKFMNELIWCIVLHETKILKGIWLMLFNHFWIWRSWKWRQMIGTLLNEALSVSTGILSALSISLYNAFNQFDKVWTPVYSRKKLLKTRLSHVFRNKVQ